MSLDTISQVLKAECCWIQTLNSGKGQLSLVASRGLSPEMEAEIASMNIDHDFSEIIVGTGQKIVIPDLSNDGMYGLSSFSSAGYRWLIAVPLLTYRVFGLMGIASRYKKHLQKETPDLALVIGGLIASALNKAELLQKSIETRKITPKIIERPDIDIVPHGNQSREPAETTESPDVTPTQPRPETKKSPVLNSSFQNHAQKMERFRQSHQG